MVWLDLGQFCDTDISGKLQNAPACRQHWEGEAPAWITVKDHSGVVHVQQVWTTTWTECTCPLASHAGCASCHGA